MTPCPHCDQAAVVDENGCCIHCGADRTTEEHNDERPDRDTTIVAVAFLLRVPRDEDAVAHEALAALAHVGVDVLDWEVHTDPTALVGAWDQTWIDDLVLHADGPTLPDVQIALIQAAYEKGARGNRSGDWQAFITEAEADPATIAYEWLDTARDLSIDCRDDIGEIDESAVFAAAQEWVRNLRS